MSSYSGLVVIVLIAFLLLACYIYKQRKADEEGVEYLRQTTRDTLAHHLARKIRDTEPSEFTKEDYLEWIKRHWKRYVDSDVVGSLLTERDFRIVLTKALSLIDEP